MKASKILVLLEPVGKINHIYIEIPIHYNHCTTAHGRFDRGSGDQGIILFDNWISPGISCGNSFTRKTDTHHGPHLFWDQATGKWSSPGHPGKKLYIKKAS